MRPHDLPKPRFLTSGKDEKIKLVNQSRAAQAVMTGSQDACLLFENNYIHNFGGRSTAISHNSGNLPLL